MPANRVIQLEIVVPNETRYLRLIGNIAEAVAKALEDYSGDREALAYNLNLVLTEAMANVIEHGSCQGRSAQSHIVRVCLSIENHDLQIRVHDQGAGFDLDSVPQPDFDRPVERGRGIFLIRALMDGVVYRKTECGNVLEMYKRLN